MDNNATSRAPSLERMIFGHPVGLYVLFFTEMWERFSYYGMRALLFLYMLQYLSFSNDDAGGVYGDYTGLVYLTPLLGGFLADRYLGLQRSIIVGAILMAIGQGLLSFGGLADLYPSQAVWVKPLLLPTFYAGLVFLVIGNGFFKPNISTLVGQLYPPGDVRRDGAFTIFYMGINVGATLAPIFCGWIGQKYSWHLGFGLAGIGMLVGLAVFLSFRHMLEGRGLRPSNEHAATHEKRPPLSDREKLRMALVAGLGGIASLLYAWNLQPPTFVAGVRATFWPLAVTFVATIWVFLMGRTHGVERRHINVIFIIGFFVMVFWCAFEQAGSSLTLFAENSTRCWIFSESWSFESSQFQTINPLCIVLFGPLFSMLWTWLALRGRDPSIPAKMAIGILINAASFGLMIFAAHAATHASADGQKLSPMWLTAFYVLQTCAELCLSPIGLSMVTRLAPARFAAMAMGIWFMSTAFGYKLAGSFGGKYDQYGPDQLFGAIALALTLAGVVLIFVVPALKRRMSDEK